VQIPFNETGTGKKAGKLIFPLLFNKFSVSTSGYFFDKNNAKTERNKSFCAKQIKNFSQGV
jgi:hypothetical protein